MTAVSPQPRHARGGRGSFTPIHWAVAGSLADVLVQMTEFLPPLASVVPTGAKAVGTTIQALVGFVGPWDLWNRRGRVGAEP